MSISTLKSDLLKIKLPERCLDMVAGLSLAVIFLIGISFQFGYSRHASDNQSLARPHTAQVAPLEDAGAVPEDADAMLSKAL